MFTTLIVSFRNTDEKTNCLMDHCPSHLVLLLSKHLGLCRILLSKKKEYFLPFPYLFISSFDFHLIKIARNRCFLAIWTYRRRKLANKWAIFLPYWLWWARLYSSPHWFRMTFQLEMYREHHYHHQTAIRALFRFVNTLLSR